jgi:hypothetical protein
VECIIVWIAIATINRNLTYSRLHHIEVYQSLQGDEKNVLKGAAGKQVTFLICESFVEKPDKDSFAFEVSLPSFSHHDTNPVPT